MATVRINFDHSKDVPVFFNDVLEAGHYGEVFIQFSSIDVFEQTVMHSRLMEKLPEDITVTSLGVTYPSQTIDRIGGSGTYVYETEYGSARVVITGYNVTIEATDPLSFLSTQRAILNDLLTQDHRTLVQNY